MSARGLRLPGWSKLACLGGMLLTTMGGEATAGGRFIRRAPTVYETQAVAPRRTPAQGTLGTFTKTPYIFVRGNGTAGGGYSPLGEYGDATMALYGPLSPLRMTAAPVAIYSRGYDGRLVVGTGTSFSTPNMPSLTPVVYPTRNSYYFAPRESGNPPWWANGMNWIDQN